MVELSLRIPFSLRDVVGEIDVSVTENTDPEKVGYSLLAVGRPLDFARGFPVCRAKVIYPADGYAAVFGWTQMVRSTDGTGEFEMDPIALYKDVATPFAWFGLRPEAFDAPSRQTRRDMIWEAQCFLCISPDAVLTRQVQAVTGFSWGFAVEGSTIRFSPLRALKSQHWDGQLALLRASYPGWRFEAGYV